MNITRYKTRSITKIASLLAFLINLLLTIISSEALVFLLLPLYIALFPLWIILLNRAWSITFALHRAFSCSRPEDYQPPSPFSFKLVPYIATILAPTLLPILFIAQLFNEIDTPSQFYVGTLLFTTTCLAFFWVTEPVASWLIKSYG